MGRATKVVALGVKLKKKKSIVRIKKENAFSHSNSTSENANGDAINPLSRVSLCMKVTGGN